MIELDSESCYYDEYMFFVPNSSLIDEIEVMWVYDLKGKLRI